MSRATVVIYFQDSFCKCSLYSFTCDDSLKTQGSLGSYIPKYFVLIRYFVSEKTTFLKCIPYIHVAIFIFFFNVQCQMSVMQMSPSYNYHIVKTLRLFNQLHSAPCMDVWPPHSFFLIKVVISNFTMRLSNSLHWVPNISTIFFSIYRILDFFKIYVIFFNGLCVTLSTWLV